MLVDLHPIPTLFAASISVALWSIEIDAHKRKQSHRMPNVDILRLSLLHAMYKQTQMKLYSLMQLIFAPIDA
ncbi:hypothetical protein BBBOND_0211790 [Babesia bigemina]|uniref:Uncharacterized protein n=1 Tax=Babesia bigemina TaxID=5866 RepID=A0A061D7R8_BABBI|nr:hypothetical protein BBBOND_0211790 [Babesia bigemina]CDR96037.1 hypothetical protein BBBOND_0211790 [Babesia bigemina]|eukprot:XP_012768223.1 hypothetical protein BBBOND_0211790 [Babesia bigemina]